MTTSAELPSENPLVAQTERQAHASIAGYIYQIEQAILRWISLGADDALYLEGVEDCDLYSPQQSSAQLCQFKARASSVSLGRAEIIETLNNFWVAVTANPAVRCELRYVTTSPVVVEQGNPFGVGVSGIALWARAATDATVAGQIRSHLLGRADLSVALRDFLKTGDLAAVQAAFFARITWTTAAPALEALEPEIRRQLVHHGDSRSFLVDACDAAYPVLFAFACKACTRAQGRRLTREDFLREFDAAAKVHRENALLKRERLLAHQNPSWNLALGNDAARGEYPALDQQDLTARLTVASKPLLAWPSTLPKGQWLPRPEYDKLVSQITTQPQSTTLLLGEPGSGKSALLSRLAAECIKLPNTVVFAIKADAVAQDVAAPDNLLPGWGGQGLARWLGVLAGRQRVVILVDQLDAVAEIMDRRTARLNVLLSLIGASANRAGIHLVASCRPFEFKHDTRLQAIEEHQQITLQPLRADSVDKTLADAGHHPERLTVDCRQLLRNPWNLNVYLRHAIPGEEVRSLGVILARVWSERIAGAPAPVGTIEFLRAVAQRVREEEQLWMPVGLSDQNTPAYRHLLAEEILVESKDGLTFGFRHQSLFDYSLLREFESAAITLSDYVWQRQDGLFVRPTLLAALRHLRVNAAGDYLRELSRLLKPPRGRSTRFHVRELLFSFVGSQGQPLPGEAALLLPLLRSSAEAPRVMRACTGSAGWFERFARDASFQRWLTAPPKRASLALGCMAAGFTVAEATAAKLVTRYWLPRPVYHPLIVRALWNNAAMGPPSLRIVTALAMKIAPSELGVILDEVQKASPSTCAEVLRISLVRRASKARGFAELGEVLDKDLWGNWSVDRFATTAAQEFLGACWPTVARILSRLAVLRNLHFGARYPDAEPTMSYPERYGQGNGLLGPLVEAARVVAQQKPDEFRRLVGSASRINHMFAQRLIANGFLNNIAELRAEATIWLLAEPRRLTLGNHFGADETVALFNALSIDADEKALAALEAAALSYVVEPDNFRGDTLVERQGYASRQTQRRRARLLKNLPRERLSAVALTYLSQAETELGEESINPPQGRSGFVGAPMPPQEMATATDDAIMALIRTLPDSTQWDHPEQRRRFDSFEKGGGAIQQSRALGVLVKENPQRGVALAPLLVPETNELYAGHLLEGLAQSNYPTADVLTIFREFCRRGFIGETFRVQSAEALEVLAKRGEGLPDDAIEILLKRLDEFPLVAEKADTDDPDAKAGRTMLYGHAMWSLTDSSSRIMSAITHGILKRPDPARHARMLTIFKRVARRPRSNFFWGQALLECYDVFVALPRPATAFLRRILRRQPGIVTRTPGRLAIAHLVPHLSPPSVGRELVKTSLRRRGAGNHQYAGELAFLVFAFHPSPSHRSMLKKQSGPHGASYLRGLAFGAVHFFKCGSTHDEARRVVSQALANKQQDISQAAFGFVRALNFHALDSIERKLVRQFLRLDLKRSSAWLQDLVERMAAACDTEPVLAVEVCTRLLETADGEEGGFRSSLSLSQQHLINMALTLHRIPDYRERGLKLFEWMLRLNLRELHDALKHLDQRVAPALSA